MPLLTCIVSPWAARGSQRGRRRRRGDAATTVCTVQRNRANACAEAIAGARARCSVQKLVAMAACMREDAVISTRGRDIMTAENDSRLDELTRRYPGWRMSRGRATRGVGALPPPRPRQHGLVRAGDAPPRARD